MSSIDKPDISIVIVSYNAWEYLALTLHSVEKATARIRAEVVVVDNASSTGIVGKVKRNFPKVKIIACMENEGFAKACNRGLEMAEGEVCVLLNPDVIVAEDTFTKVIAFFKHNQHAGGLGFRMFNGSGQYLKESKRGLPTPMVSLFKLIGLTALFPSSGFFARYYHGELNERDNHAVDILTGAFFAQKRNQSGGFEFLDERYFMYGEDVDLSYSIARNQGANHFIGTSPIIHFKGGTTPRKDFIYRSFYDSMWLFYHKYFYLRYPRVLNALVWLSIKGILNLKLLHLRMPRAEAKQQSRSFNTVRVMSGDQRLKVKIQSLFKESEVHMAGGMQFDGDADQLLVFDLASISHADAIAVMDENGPSNYAFASATGDFMVLNNNDGSKGMVYHY